MIAACPFCGAGRAPQLDHSYRSFDDQSAPVLIFKVTCNPYLGGCGGSSGHWDSYKLALQQWSYTSRAILGDDNDLS